MEKNFFSFLFYTVFYSVIPNETIRMPFRGLTMTKSRKLTKKGGLCYRFAMVTWRCTRWPDEYYGQLTNHRSPGHNTHPLDQSETSIHLFREHGAVPGGQAPAHGVAQQHRPLPAEMVQHASEEHEPAEIIHIFIII